jgi:hypothetical protein
MKVLARVREQRDGVLAAGRASKSRSCQHSSGFCPNSNYLYLAEKDECKTSLDSSRGKTRFSERALTLVMA